jgi:hypothetical protein
VHRQFVCGFRQSPYYTLWDFLLISLLNTDCRISVLDQSQREYSPQWWGSLTQHSVNCPPGRKIECCNDDWRRCHFRDALNEVAACFPPTSIRPFTKYPTTWAAADLTWKVRTSNKQISSLRLPSEYDTVHKGNATIRAGEWKMRGSQINWHKVCAISHAHYIHTLYTLLGAGES